jgi:hypothetical protein
MRYLNSRIQSCYRAPMICFVAPRRAHQRASLRAGRRPSPRRDAVSVVSSVVMTRSANALGRGVGQAPDAASKTPIHPATETSSAKPWTCIFSISLWR